MQFVFDTNVASELDHKQAAERRAFWASLYRTDSYAVAPLVIFEKLNTLRYSSPDEYLPVIRRELHALRGPRLPRVLPLPRMFLGHTVLGLTEDHPIASADVLSKILEVARKRTSSLSRHRKTRDVWLFPHKTMRKGFNVTEVLRVMDEGQKSMFAAIKSAPGTDVELPSPEEWARDAIAQEVLPNDAEACQKLAAACPAAYRFQIFLWRHARTGYNPIKKGNRGDWIDQQLLLYLADPSVVLVTGEKDRLRHRIGQCGQEDRVWAFEDVWARYDR